MKLAPVLFLAFPFFGCTAVRKNESQAESAPANVPIVQEVSKIIEGPTIEAVCNKFLDDYFKDLEKEGKERPHHGLTMIEDGEDQARVRYYVYYAIWGYDEELLLKKNGELWRIVGKTNFRNLDFN